MYESYFKFPLNLEETIGKKELEKTTLEQSIQQHLQFIATTSFGECKHDDLFGCGIWEIDFLIFPNNTFIREHLKAYLKESIKRYEKRIENISVDVEISDSDLSPINAKVRAKKRADIFVNATLKKNNKAFSSKLSFYIGPLSYH
ncbi:GPW/gp25 family protein [Xanthovirga aplysinae]|uniref:GPW/gp25 family protein n=1 Tax=Xanthovirga aplysinae TaxID=2529853 RepID=UPI0012BB5A5D|nr:GPW/gp25 family protein [Xanthovirga aplysinae]MTI31849.1 lysozyme [Xanthovirga aplysinae]